MLQEKKTDAQIQKEIDALESEIEPIRAEIAELEAEIAGPLTEIESLEAEIDGNLQPAVDSAHSELESLLDALDACREK